MTADKLSVRHYLKIIYRKLFKKKSGFIRRSARIYHRQNTEIDKTAQIREFVIIQANRKVKIGKYSQLNPFVVIYGGVTIGDYVMIAPHVMIASGNHNFTQMEKPMRFAGSVSKGKVVIEDDVWIGANSTILDGVTVGKGAVIGAGSVVNCDIEPYSINAGVPIKKIGSRLDYLPDD